MAAPAVPKEPPRAGSGLSPAWRAAIPVAVALVLWFLPPFWGLKPGAMHMIGLFVGTILGLILQPLPQGAVVLLGVALTALTGTLSVGDSLNGFANSTVWLIVSAFLFARGFIKTGLGRRIAYLMIRSFGKSTLGLSYAIAASDLIIAPATPSNTARAGGILFPIVRSLAASFGSEPGPTARKAGAFLMLTEYQVNLVTSAMFLTSVAPAPLVAELARKNFNVEITWLGWAAAAIVPGLVSLLLIPYLLYRLYPPEVKQSPDAPRTAAIELERMGPMSGGEKAMLAVFLLTLVLWATGQWNGLHETAIALGGVAALIVLGVITWKDVLGETGGWDALVWFGGLVSLANGLSKWGVIKALAGSVQASLGSVGSWVLVLFLVIVLYLYLHYFIASMTAHVTAFFVPLAAVAIALGAPAYLVAISLGVFSSLNASLTHYGTGPAPIYFGAGYVDQATWWKYGFLLSLVNLAVWVGLGGLWWKVIGIW
ncbi:anion permease [Caldinitratiruptor microaerophilus]|uniref:Malate transporter YflS n=1 Tax=Caldinitratiruptor microaerophilus TaxID=671077 RepID=A0AA35CIX7_9FIRM|nr:anion permease [Caldinitratiruptor microaerophilus]BDG59203.1 putative malate transporter YflS [Caldinitratiruptor microaerophilus]